jgi:hypothetical protein
VPPLARGLWRVIANGAPAFELPVEHDSGLIAPPPGCATYAAVDECAPSSPVPGRPWSGSWPCAFPSAEGRPLDVVRIRTSDCGRCNVLAGPCYATLSPRYTDDLPPGGDIDVAPSEYGTACDVTCSGECRPEVRDCVVPALTGGDFYRVSHDGRGIGSFTAGAGSSSCPVPP